MKINDLKNVISFKEFIHNNNVDINKIEFDSRKISEGDIFVAIPGTVSDGHKFIDIAVHKGAKTIICETLPSDINDETNYIVVESSSKTLGIISSEYYGNPSRKLKLIGITGTNGKTTIATTLFNLVRKLGYKSGLISTIQIMIENTSVTATHTTPDPIQLNYYLNEMVDTGCDYCFMEVSSHSTVQNRIAGLTFAGGVFTNITHDHLDFHKTFKEYIKAKQLFFDQLPKEAFALTNIDDKNGDIIIQNTKARKYSYSLRSASDFKIKILESHFDGMLLKMNNSEIWTNFIGKFNAYNLLAVYATTILCGFNEDEVLLALTQLKPVEGRFETIHSGTGITAIVDYAHTPDALENVISTINAIRNGSGQLITVVGAGGDRDKTKRPEMASIAAELSDKLILTSDNPRTEDPEAILNDMQEGVNVIQKKKMLRISNREEAIRTACMLAKTDDIILIAGKGHEKYQEINGVKHHFDDKEIIINAFKELK
ncbi:MAG: UDP-N-acetylmuramoyl-L-alanyl-D-glutamate--2,6-diaminopimelate ligase [Bacteroidales bacterium]|jgi:UDP-N-acetylmuramoyl-L-alanyl-D-glutamate--2,6-diaminopimelate ligase|nr:UDP-N-acetylmuramoyl-L-alanyl-D-glutamate--2,6-diaminopimelate ligase [Bacteroidales bacterium]